MTVMIKVGVLVCIQVSITGLWCSCGDFALVQHRVIMFLLLKELNAVEIGKY